MGGEKQQHLTGHPDSPGSPPRGRGKELQLHLRHLKSGITPAWAGKRLGILVILASDGDHPRVGGEKTMVEI